jgi:hypothetical protein
MGAAEKLLSMRAGRTLINLNLGYRAVRLWPPVFQEHEITLNRLQEIALSQDGAPSRKGRAGS